MMDSREAGLQNEHQSLSPTAAKRWIILLAAFVNGFVIMSIELLGGRVMAPYFGSSVYVWGSIITVFMLSLSFGYLWGGRLSLNNPGPRTFLFFFWGSAVLCLPVIYLAEPLMTEVFLSIEDPRYGSLLSAILLYFLPICLMGMVSPYSVRMLVARQSHSGGIAGELYFVSTLGSALGTLGTSFYFVIWFEINQIVWGCIAAQLICGTVVAIAFREQIFSGKNKHQTAENVATSTANASGGHS